MAQSQGALALDQSPSVFNFGDHAVHIIAGWRQILLEAIADRAFAEMTLRQSDHDDRMWSCMWRARCKCDEMAIIALDACGGLASEW